MNNQNHPFHIISPSPWPLLVGIRTIRTLIGTILWVCTNSIYLLIVRVFLLTFLARLWWRDVSRERSLQGCHSNQVTLGLRRGILLFIVSEIFFFISFFWTFFHSRLAPNLELGGVWPPLGALALNPFHIPLLNTVILLSSGISVTWRHHSLIKNINQLSQNTLLLTIVLGAYFTLLQAWEYWDASYSFADSIFGSSFFLATGFHGAHVFIGTMFLLVSFARQNINFTSNQHHIGFEIAIWYWHFVDVVWLFLYSFLYWWSFFIISTKSILDFQSKDFLKIIKFFLF